MNDQPNVIAQVDTGNFYRMHTFDKKGPTSSEVKAYLRSLSLFMPCPKGEQPKSSEEIRTYLHQQRAALFPEQMQQVQALRTARAMRKHELDRAERAKR